MTRSSVFYTLHHSLRHITTVHNGSIQQDKHLSVQSDSETHTGEGNAANASNIRRRLTELGPIQKFCCWIYLTLS